MCACRGINYHNFREHEVKALWMWLQVSGAKLATIGAKVMVLPAPAEHDLQLQQVARLVACCVAYPLPLPLNEHDSVAVRCACLDVTAQHTAT